MHADKHGSPKGDYSEGENNLFNPCASVFIRGSSFFFKMTQARKLTGFAILAGS